MATITMKVPDTLRDQAQELANEMGYQSMSEYVRTALREKIEKDLVKSRLQDDEEMITLEEARDLVNAADGSNGSPKLTEGPEGSNTKAETANP